MTYTDEELVRELEWRYPDCEFVMDARKRLLEYSAEIDRLVGELDEAHNYEVLDEPIDNQYLRKEYTG